MQKKEADKAETERSRVSVLFRREMPSLLISIVMAALMAAGVAGIEGVSVSLALFAATGAFLFSSFILHSRDASSAVVNSEDKKDKLRVSVVIPVFNEEPELLRRGLESISSQTRVPDRVWIIDDGSAEPDCAQIARQWAKEQADRGMSVQVIVLPQNSGKRKALVKAFKNDSDSDIFFTVDSDTILDSNAIKQGLIPFRDLQVFAVAGVLYGHNRDQSLLTRLIELEFVCGFLINRATMSQFGSVLVTCGSLAGYRAKVCREHVDELINETFLGKPVVNGDDRKLTQFALQEGKVVLQQSCTGRVALPQSVSHLFRQRTRWSTSFYRGTIFMLRNMPLKRTAFWLTLAHAGMFCLQTLLLIGIIVFGSTIGWLNLAAIIAAVTVPGVVERHKRYWNSEGVDRSVASRLEILTLSPLSTLMTVLVLMPARYFALFHLRSNQWRTRGKVEAVTLKKHSSEGENTL